MEISHVREMAPPGGGFCGLMATRVTVTTPEAPGANSRMVPVLPITIGSPGWMEVAYVTVATASAPSPLARTLSIASYTSPLETAA